MKDLVRKSFVEQVQYFSFIYFTQCFAFYFYFSTGYLYLFYKKILQLFSNEYWQNKTIEVPAYSG